MEYVLELLNGGWFLGFASGIGVTWFIVSWRLKGRDNPPI